MPKRESTMRQKIDEYDTQTTGQTDDSRTYVSFARLIRPNEHAALADGQAVVAAISLQRARTATNSICAKASVIMMKYTPLVRSDNAPMTQRKQAPTPRAPPETAAKPEPDRRPWREDADRIAADAEIGGMAEADHAAVAPE